MKRAAVLLFAAAMMLIPRRRRFGAILFCARLLAPFQRRAGAFDGPAETAVHRIVLLLTNLGVPFDPVVAWEGYDAFVRLCREGRGVLLAAPHAALGQLSIRTNHDAGLQPITITSDPMRIAGTRIEAETIQPSPAFLVTARRRLMEGRLVGAMLDRAEHEGERTFEVATAQGPVIVAPGLLRLAARCGVPVAFVEAHVEDGKVAGTFAIATSTTEEGLTEEFVDFVRSHVRNPQPATRNPLRLLAAAALLHVTLALLLFAAGRMQLAPNVVNRDGIVAAAADSILYQHQAIAHDPSAPPHVRLLSIAFDLFGTTILAAEPLNLLFYLAIVGLTFAVAREAGGPRAGAAAAVIVALWPTLVLHTLQFLKDPLFIAGALALVFVVMTWLTRTYDWRGAAAAALVLSGAAAVLLLVRGRFAVIVVALIALSTLLLVVRQIAERRLLIWNLACALVALAAALLIATHAERTLAHVKTRSFAARGESKTFTGGRTRVPTIVMRGAPAPTAADEAALALGSIRSRYILSDAASGSGLDDDVTFRNAREMIAYLPRAAAIGLWAPFPATWGAHGRVTGRSGRVLAAMETAAMYVIEILAVVGIFLPPRRLPSFLLLVIAVPGVTILGAAVSNLGTLYRFRYPFWVMLIAAGAAGGTKVVRGWRAAAVPVMACAALFLWGCARAPRPDLAITNRTGWKLVALYLSASDAPTWEENVLGGDVLRDGETVAVRFAPGTAAPLWDLRVDGGRYRAEWRRLDRKTISRIDIRVSRGAVVAEVR